MKRSIRSKGIYYSYNVTNNISNDISLAEVKKTHCHPNYEIMHIIKGSGRFIIDGREYPIKPHTMFLLAPFEYQHIEFDEECAVYERQILFFQLDDLTEEGKKIFQTMSENKKGMELFYPPEAVTQKMLFNLGRYNELFDLPEMQRNAYAQLLLTELIVYTSMTRIDELRQLNINLAAQVVDYINQNIGNNFSLDELSKRFFVSKYYLCRAFKKHNGISVHGYINQKRIIYAKHLIDSGESASAAAYKVGFGDYSAFYRAYVKFLGTSPTSNAENKEFMYENS